MSDSTTLLEQIDGSQAQHEVTANNLFDASSPSAAYGRHAEACAGLTWGYYGTRYGGTAVANGTNACGASTTTYMVVNLSTGAVSFSTATTNWNDSVNYARCYKIVTGAASVTSYEDHRFGPLGVFSAAGSSSNLADLADVQIAGSPGPGDGQVLTFDAVLNKWVASAAASGSAAYNDSMAADAFGDSIMNGTGASSSPNQFRNLIAEARGWTITNHSASGDMVADQADEVFGLSVTDEHQSLLMLGTNDQRTYTTNTYKQGAFKAGHMALLAWLAIPDARKQYGQNADSETGTWTDTIVYGGALGRQSIVGTSTITFTAYGSVVYVATILQNSINAVFTVSVDGVVKGTYQCMPGNSTTITSINGLTYMPALIRIPGLSEASHSVVITVSTASTSNPVYVLWVAGNQGHRTKDGPNVWVGNVPRFTSSGYSGSGGSDAVVAIFNDMIRQNVDTLSADGLNIALVDSAARLNPAVDLDVDGVHPDNSGHAIIAEAFLEAINQIQKPRTMGVQPPTRRLVNQQSGTTYKLVCADHDKEVRIGNASAQTITVPTNVEVPFEIGTVIPVVRSGAGSTTIAGDTGVTVNAAGGLVLSAQYEKGELVKIDPLTWDFSRGAAAEQPVLLQFAASDEGTALTTGTAKVTLRGPNYAWTLQEINASLSVAQTSGSTLTVDVNEAGASLLSTKLTFDNTERTTLTATTAPVISDSAIAANAEITVDIDTVGDGTAKGLKITMMGVRA